MEGKTKAPRSRRHFWGVVFAVLGTVMVAAAACLFSYNQYLSARAGQESGRVLASLTASIADQSLVDTSGEGYLIDGHRYCGFLEIPSQDLTLPVLSTFSYDGLNVAPCCYSGTAKDKDLVIAAHSFASHFGNLSSLDTGARVLFTSCNGKMYRYAVQKIEVVEPGETKRVVDSKWDLTLFSCTYTGAQRVVVRCNIDDKS